MNAWIIDTRGNGYLMRTRRRNPLDAVCDLMERIDGCIEVRRQGAEREPREITAEWLMANCRELTIY